MNGKAPFPVPKLVRTLTLAALLSSAALIPSYSTAADLPLAASSPLSGVAFDDRPLLLPVQRNFQMALLTASSEIGRSCGKMEAYGWRMGATEQQRVNQIFTSTVEKLRAMGYSVESQSPSSVSADITLFTADRPDHHFIFMWSAGEIGLAMVLCESSAPVSGQLVSKAPSSVQVFPQTSDVLSSELQSPVANPSRRSLAANFTPVGDWVGSYTCTQGYTGGTLHIATLNGQDFSGTFKFYPTSHNPTIPAGRYTVYGQYDRATQRILINPGKWLERPHNYYNTIMVGSFDPVARTFSAYFQGINGCTSFEAKGGDEDIEALHKGYKASAYSKATKKKIKPKKKKHVPAKAATGAAPAASPASSAMGSSAAPVSIVPDHPPSNVTTAAPPAAAVAAPTPSVPATPAPAVAAPEAAAPAPTPVAPAPATPAPATAAFAPSAAPAPAATVVAPALQPAPAPAPAPSAPPAPAADAPPGRIVPPTAP